jgi:hypothetical protein
MTKLDQAKEFAASLDSRDLRKLSDWIAELKAQQLDDQIEAQVLAGNFDELANQAMIDHRNGKTRAL